MEEDGIIWSLGDGLEVAGDQALDVGVAQLDALPNPECKTVNELPVVKLLGQVVAISYSHVFWERHQREHIETFNQPLD